MYEIERIVSSYHGDGTWRRNSGMLDSVTAEMLNKNLSKTDVIDAIYRGLLNSQYLQGQSVRNTYCRCLANAAWKRIEWRSRNER